MRGSLAAMSGQGRGVAIDRLDAVSVLGQQQRMPSVAAGEVQHRAARRDQGQEALDPG
jgi:hypothetical protein